MSTGWTSIYLYDIFKECHSFRWNQALGRLNCKALKIDWILAILVYVCVGNGHAMQAWVSEAESGHEAQVIQNRDKERIPARLLSWYYNRYCGRAGMRKNNLYCYLQKRVYGVEWVRSLEREKKEREWARVCWLCGPCTHVVPSMYTEPDVSHVATISLLAGPNLRMGRVKHSDFNSSLDCMNAALTDHSRW